MKGNILVARLKQGLALCCLGLLLQALSLQAFAMAEVKNVRLWLAPDHTRLVFDLSGEVKHEIFPLNNPSRLVIDIPRSELSSSLSGLDFDGTPIKRIRSGRRNGDDLRIVLDLDKQVQPRSFTLTPNQKYGHRLVVDLVKKESAQTKTLSAATKANKQSDRRDVVIAIDAGHGGEDPGALGPGRVQEKDVVLSMAQELADYLKAEPGFKPLLTRKGDYYIPLRKRIRMVREYEPDLFVSIHADAFKDPRANGASVWTLSQSGASSEMGRWLAGRENSTDLVGGVGINDKDDILAGVLLDMSMTASISDSREVGSYVLRNMGQVARLHKKSVEHAGFVVLKSPDIPSILVETGFISNPGEARLLKTRAYQRKIARSIFYGIKQHFTRKPPAMTWLAWQAQGGEDAGRYKVVKGDTLSVIASRNGVSLSRLREANNLDNDVIRVGQVLQIPAS